jgi:aminopeptidase N
MSWLCLLFDLLQENQFYELTLSQALSRDSLKSSHPIATPVDNPDQINELFDSISYFKVRVLVLVVL